MGQEDDVLFGAVWRAAFPEFTHLFTGIEAQGHRMRHGDRFTKLPLGQVIEVEQIHFNPFLKIFLKNNLPVRIGALDFERSHRVRRLGSSLTSRYVEHRLNCFKCISFQTVIYEDESFPL